MFELPGKGVSVRDCQVMSVSMSVTPVSISVAPVSMSVTPVSV